MAGRSAYRGVGLQGVDEKGRVAIPANLRAALERNTDADAGSKNARTFLIGAHETERCLVAYDEAQGDALWEQLEARERDYTGERGEIDFNILREGAGAAETAQYDSSGRFILPAFPRSYARIGRHAFFYGVLKRVEIWDPKTLLEHERAPEIMKEACRFYMAEKGIEP
ncbi:division/cell wall cluster transcriptional repressor MraZ [Stakelama saccharophila]|uniref:Transcriptional regulator MraZ n=1 Tax=Stakelama saccharophila TaxID=3075605 RepID=A0ABZ0B749_9SPHN|nr:division/cell wall cluster transcriptional repressor MraZ [Stakelama sp. W311]WNO53119.1 division/cell wall cluster transcriptional repressor MraZ [Stakelama sp. W311]